MLFVAILPAQGPRCEMFQVTGLIESRNDQRVKGNRRLQVRREANVR